MFMGSFTRGLEIRSGNGTVYIAYIGLGEEMWNLTGAECCLAGVGGMADPVFA